MFETVHPMYTQEPNALSYHAFHGYKIWIFTHLKLCLATAIHNFKWVKITHIC